MLESSSSEDVPGRKSLSQDVGDRAASALDVFAVYEVAEQGDLVTFDTEKAIIKEMCNVVWRALEN